MRAWLLAIGIAAAGCNAASSLTGPDLAPALTCRGYGPEATSPYVLPYAVGEAYLVEQSNCSAGGHYPGGVYKYGYDFSMRIGTPVRAARAGVVIDVEGRYEDANRIPGKENYVFVEHDDGSVARYFHLTKDGALVAAGQVVQAGDLVGLSGDTGFSDRPHLHFDVVPRFCEARTCTTLPITFSNTAPHPGGLVVGVVYEALVLGALSTGSGQPVYTRQ